MRTRTFIAVLFAALASGPAAAGDGLPLTGSTLGGPPILEGKSGQKYVVLRAGGDSVVARFGGVVYTSRLVLGTYAIPQVALDGAPAGLSADGSTLVLISPRQTFPRQRTAFAVLDPRSLRVRQFVRLQGDFSFDALSPDGTTMYLVEYLSPNDPTSYRVRAYSLPGKTLLPTPIVDKSEPDEEMRGYPVTRVTSADGRFAYTLYDGGGHEPFVHALDTKQGEARCIDLDMLTGNPNLYGMRLVLRANGTRLAVVNGGRQVTAVDTRTYLPVANVSPANERSGSRSAIAVVAILALLGVGGALYGIGRVLRNRGARAHRRRPERRSSHPVA